MDDEGEEETGVLAEDAGGRKVMLLFPALVVVVKMGSLDSVVRTVEESDGVVVEVV